MRTLNILFLGGAKRVSLAECFINAGKELDLNINIFSYELNENCPISFVGEVIIGEMWNSPKLIDHLKQTISQKEIDIVLPFVDPATIVAANLKEELGECVFVPVGSPQFVDSFFNKKRTTEWCETVCIPFPKFDGTFPAIVKPVNGSASKGIEIIYSKEEFDSSSKKLNDYVVQRFIRGKEYTVDCYVSVNNNKLICSVPRERLEMQGGESIKSITIKDFKIIDFVHDIIKKSGLIGPITVQLLWDENSGDLYFMEINPRFGGAVVTSIGAGANIPLYLLKDYLNIEQSYQENWEDKTLMIRRFTEYFVKDADNN
ncbi:ATP-grasp domain-containing protein [Ancylomarina sp. DW003]|nr:ATP-grasp domain-containing protein [Ancylomarina sp. DW003]MDE5421907.1 ATP-grasp domain-containing protein [Ancylomarina sp. DW003]